MTWSKENWPRKDFVKPIKAFKVVLREGYKPNSLVNEVAGVQNIESMTPENPIAAKLAALKQRVDQIYSTVVTPRRSENT